MAGRKRLQNPTKEYIPGLDELTAYVNRFSSNSIVSPEIKSILDYVGQEIRGIGRSIKIALDTPDARDPGQSGLF